MRFPARAGAIVAVSGLVVLGTAIPAQSNATKYSALGDSYSSGTGTREYFDEDCQLSKQAFPEQVAAEQGMELNFAACSGALIDEVQNDQLGGLDDSTNVVSVSAGGNDAGWGDVVTQCALPGADCQDDVDGAEEFINDELPGRLDALYNDIRSAAPNAQVVVVGYPRLFNGEDCQAGTFFSAEEMESLNGAADLLDDTTAGVASNHGFSFADPREAFTGHATCDEDAWVNGLSNPVSESYHPNGAGHDAYTELVGGAL